MSHNHYKPWYARTPRWAWVLAWIIMLGALFLWAAPTEKKGRDVGIDCALILTRSGTECR